MKRHNSLFLATLFAGAILVAPLAAQVAVMQPAGASIQWSPLVEYERLVVTVSGGGSVLRSEFAADEAPSLRLEDGSGNALPDGSYTWEIRVIPAGPKLERTPGGDQGMEATRAPRVQSGYFQLRDGAVVGSDTAEAAAQAAPAGDAGPIVPKDQVFVDDVIVQGSECVGLDCVNGEVFGFDTLRLKENNLRIRFFDTSNSASFPTNDWEITANDTSNGGANKFSITDIDGGRVPFTIRAGAPSNSLFVSSAGRLGIRTATPVVNIHVVEGNTPTLRLEQDGSSGFTAQTWDVAGNEANFFIRDVTNGSKLPVQIKPSAPTASIFVAADGDVGLGTSSPDQRLHIKNGNLKIGETDEAATRTIRFSNDQNQWLFQNSSAGGGFSIRNATAGVTPFSIDTGAPANLLKLTAAGVEVTNVVVHPPDYVFEPDYELESIEEHAAYMWENKHLPAVGAGRVNEQGHTVFSLSDQPLAMLEELEKAHIYIDQLNDQAQEKDARIADLEAAKAEILERLARLEQSLTAGTE